MKLKRWMVITPIFLALGGSVVLYGCSSSVRSSNTYCDDCGACSNCTYSVDGNSYQCGEYGCLGENFSCNNVGDCLGCFGLGCTTMVSNCFETSCNGASNQDVTRELFIGDDFVYRTAPEIINFQMIYTEDGNYHYSFSVHVKFEFFDTVADVQISANILYNGEVVGSFIYNQEDYSTAILRDFVIHQEVSSLPIDATQDKLSVYFTKVVGTVKAD